MMHNLGHIMKKEEIAVLAQLLTAIKEGIVRLEDAKKEKNAEELASAKKEILKFQKEIDKLL